MGLFVNYSCVPLSFYQNSWQQAKTYFDSSPFEVSESLKQLPYAMEVVKYDGSLSVMVLGYVDKANRLTYLDAEGNSLTLLNGKIIESHGFKNNMEIQNPPDINQIFLQLLNNEGSHYNYSSLIRFSNPATPLMELITSYSIIENENRTFTRIIDSSRTPYIIIQEEYNVPLIHWKGSNIFWVGLNGEVLKSKQQIIPDEPKFQLETLKAFEG